MSEEHLFPFYATTSVEDDHNATRSTSDERSGGGLRSQDEELVQYLALQERICLDNYTPSPEAEEGLVCERTWDGWECWNETRGGETAYMPCPFFITGFDSSKIAHKECLPNGTWFKNPVSGQTWSNYTTCVDVADLEWRQIVISLYEIGYIISISALLVSLIIFCSFKCLACTRVRIHKHLFVSFIISNIFWLCWYRSVIVDPHVLFDHPTWCKILHIFVEYFMMANYFWMFCEGLYLHTLLVVAFFRSEKALIRGFYIFGWLGPSLPIGIYIYMRETDPHDNRECWVAESSWRIILGAPVCISLVLSLGFLINILRVLVKKIKESERTFGNVGRGTAPDDTSNDHHSLKKAVRATLLLIPLLGLYYFLIPFRPTPGTHAEMIYEVISALASSLQGFCVSLLFCFANSEVLAIFRRKVCRRIFKESPHHRAENSCAPTNRVNGKTYGYESTHDNLNGGTGLTSFKLTLERVESPNDTTPLDVSPI